MKRSRAVEALRWVAAALVLALGVAGPVGAGADWQCQGQACAGTPCGNTSCWMVSNATASWSTDDCVYQYGSSCYRCLYNCGGTLWNCGETQVGDRKTCGGYGSFYDYLLQHPNP